MLAIPRLVCRHGIRFKGEIAEPSQPLSVLQPATSDTPNRTGTAGKFSPVWMDEGAYAPVVLYDKSFDSRAVLPNARRRNRQSNEWGDLAANQFQQFPARKFPAYTTAIFESVALMLSRDQ